MSSDLVERSAACYNFCVDSVENRPSQLRVLPIAGFKARLLRHSPTLHVLLIWSNRFAMAWRARAYFVFRYCIGILASERGVPCARPERPTLVGGSAI